MDQVELVAVVDIDGERARQAGERFHTRGLTSHLELAGEVDAAVVAVPSSRHFQVAADLLSAGIHLLVEKPLATTVADAEQLCRLAKEKDLHLQVGHLERFNPIFNEAMARVRKPRTIRMCRCGPFPGRGGDVGVVLELMSHDLDILSQMTQAPVVSVSASGSCVFTSHLDRARARIEFQDGLIAELDASRTGAERMREFTVEDEDGLLEVNLAQRSLTRHFSNHSSRPSEFVEHEAGDPLQEQDQAFVAVLSNGHGPLVGGQEGKAAVSLAAQILRAIRNGEGC